MRPYGWLSVVRKRIGIKGKSRPTSHGPSSYLPAMTPLDAGQCFSPVTGLLKQHSGFGQVELNTPLRIYQRNEMCFEHAPSSVTQITSPRFDGRTAGNTMLLVTYLIIKCLFLIALTAFAGAIIIYLQRHKSLNSMQVSQNRTRSFDGSF